MSSGDENASFGYWVRRQRKALDLTQIRLAHQVSCAVATIKKIESGERRPSSHMAERLADCLAIPAEERAAFLRVARAQLLLQQLVNAPRLDTNVAVVAESIPSKRLLVNTQSPSLSTNLPHRLTSFIGRDQETVALQDLVKDQRLVTLTGVGGVGKSSLALAVAETLDFPDGVWLVELSSIAEGGLVAQALADLFQLPELARCSPLEAVCAYLQQKTLLLIVDNCEHLITTCTELVEHLLRTAPSLHIMATSREPLNATGEHEWLVLPLPTPTYPKLKGSICSLSQIQSFAAAQLFIERAQAVKADLHFTDQDAPLIVRICQQVDGIPLALELVATYCKSFALSELVDRLEDRFALLSVARRTALLRHQTLRATINWSYELLTPAEAICFRRLGIFAGGWTIKAAEGMSDSKQGQPPTFELLHQLVNKSLVIAEQRGATTRYRMLEPIRQYACEKLQEQGEIETIKARHFAYYLVLAERSLQADLLGKEFEEWCNEIKVDLDNFRAAFAWSQTQNDRNERCLRLAVALGLFWQLRENVTEGRVWMECALAHADPENIELYSWGLIWLAFTLLHTAPRSLDLATEALQSFTALNQPAGIATANLLLGIWAAARDESGKAIDYLLRALTYFEKSQSLTFLDSTYYYLANAYVSAGQIEEALHYYQLGLQLGERVDDYEIVTSVLEGIAVIDHLLALALFKEQLKQQRQQNAQARVAALLHSLGIVLTVKRELPEALAALTKSLALWQRLGILWSPAGGIARAALDLTLAQYLSGDYQKAIIYAQKSIQLYEEADDWHGIAMAHMALGYSALAVNDLTLALESFRECLRRAAARDIDCTYMAVMGLAEIARRQENLLLAARLFGLAERFDQRLAPHDDRWKKAFCRPLLAGAYTELCDAACVAAWADGAASDLSQVIDYALDVK